MTTDFEKECIEKFKQELKMEILQKLNLDEIKAELIKEIKNELTREIKAEILFEKLPTIKTEKTDVPKILDIKLSDYSDKSFVVFGNTKVYKEKIKELGGRYNQNLKNIGAGWIFNMSKKEQVKNWLFTLE